MYIYLLSLLISAIIIYLINIDLKFFNIKIYDKLTPIIWFKLYSIITIGLIHLIWILNIFFNNYNDNNIFYGVPYILIIPYIIYIVSQIYIDENENIVSEKINVYLNYLISIYFLIIILIIGLPNKLKIDIINYIKKILYKFFPFLFIS